MKDKILNFASHANKISIQDILIAIVDDEYNHFVEISVVLKLNCNVIDKRSCKCYLTNKCKMIFETCIHNLEPRCNSTINMKRFRL